MLDLYELERLFNNWLKAKHSVFTCELLPHFITEEHYKLIKVEVRRKNGGRDSTLLTTISASGKNPEALWDTVYDKLFAYFMEIGKHVE